MNTRSLSWLIATMAALLVLGSNLVMAAQDAGKGMTQQLNPSHLLDGKIFVTDQEKPDELIFKDGTFFSVTCAKWGFKPSPVVASVEGDAIRFKTKSVSAEHGTMAWQGTVKGDTMKVSYEWTKERWYGDAHEIKEFNAILKK